MDLSRFSGDCRRLHSTQTWQPLFAQVTARYHFVKRTANSSPFSTDPAFAAEMERMIPKCEGTRSGRGGFLRNHLRVGPEVDHMLVIDESGGVCDLNSLIIRNPRESHRSPCGS